MSLQLVALIVWLGVVPLAFAAVAVLLPPHLRRRATSRVRGTLAEVIDLKAAQDQRRGVAAARASRAL